MGAVLGAVALGSNSVTGPDLLYLLGGALRLKRTRRLGRQCGAPPFKTNLLPCVILTCS